MRLFEKFIKHDDDWGKAYVSNPKFYRKQTGEAFGVYALSEDTFTVLPENPVTSSEFSEVKEWKIVFISTKEKRVLGDMDYALAIEKMKKCQIEKRKNQILIRGLSSEEMKHILDE